MNFDNIITQQILKCKSGNEKIVCYAQYYIECLENVANKNLKKDNMCNIFVKESAILLSEELKVRKVKKNE